jgi:hypothetical protein
MERGMKGDVKMSLEDVAIRRERRFEAMRLQEIEGNPLSAGDIAMFELFERERWTDDRCLDYLQQRTRQRLKQTAHGRGDPENAAALANPQKTG